MNVKKIHINPYVRHWLSDNSAVTGPGSNRSTSTMPQINIIPNPFVLN